MRTLPLLAVLLLTGAVFACSGDDVLPQAPTSVSTSTVDVTPSELATRSPESVSSTPGPVETGLPESVSLERVFPDLSFERMTGLYQLPSGSWLVTEQAGRVLITDRVGLQSSVVLDLTDRVSDSGNEEGILGLAISPDFVETSAVYLYYSASDPRRSVISRFDLGPDGAGSASEEIILEVQQPFSNHNGGQIAFGPDGFLYVALGDGGSARDPQDNGQNLETLLGALLRIDVSGGGNGYSLPRDNPFVGQGRARGEIWAYGLRNPWRFSFDAVTGDLWLGDVGQSAREEIDLITKGGNYGWSIMEGLDCLGGGSDCNQAELILPVFEYENSGGNCSVTGGFAYRGSVPSLQGAYLYSDFCSGRIWALRHDGTGVTLNEQIAETDFNVSSFAQGNDLEVFVLEHSGAGGIYKIVP